MIDLRDLAASTPVQDIPALLGRIAEAEAILKARLYGGAAIPIPADSPSRWSTAEQIGTALNVRASAVYEWHRGGRIPGEYFGRFLRFNLDAVRAALATNPKTVRLGSARKPLSHNGSPEAPTSRLPQGGAA